MRIVYYGKTSETNSMPRSAPHMPQKLAEVAFRLLSEDGFDKISVDRVAAEAGVTKGSLYAHYRSKNELILAACNVYYLRWSQKVQKILSNQADANARLRDLVEFCVQRCVIDRKSRIFTTEIFALTLHDAAIRLSWHQFYDTVREQFVALLKAAQADRHVGDSQERRKVDLMLCALEGLKLRSVHEPHIGEASEQQALVEELLGVLTREDSGTPSIERTSRSA
jgi:AcrR family transcriptional regulator